MENKFSPVRIAAAILGAAILIAVLIFILQVPSISPRRLLLGERVVGGGQFWLLELLAGAISSTIISLAAIFVARKFMFWIATLSSAIQVAWFSITQNYVTPSDSSAELMFRVAEPLGIVLGALIAILVARGIFPQQLGPTDRESAKN